MSKRDYYDVLGVAKNSSDDEIKKKYRQLAMKFHPDRNADGDKESAELQFKEVKEAYECLSDLNRRTAYNMHGHTATDPNFNPQQRHHHYNHTVDINEIFGNMFGGAGNPFVDMFNPKSQQQVRQSLNITLVDAYKGTQLRLPGGLAIQIPAGVRSGTRFIHENVIYQIEIQPHAKFKRANDDLLVDIEISSIEAMLGIPAQLDHLDNNQLQFAIPVGIQTGQVVRLGNKGMKNPETDKFGDLMIRVTITTPKDLTNEQIAFLKTMQHRDMLNI